MGWVDPLVYFDFFVLTLDNIMSGVARPVEVNLYILTFLFWNIEDYNVRSGKAGLGLSLTCIL